MALSSNRQMALDSLRKLITQQQAPELEKGLMGQLQKMGISSSPVGADIMSKRIADLFGNVTKYQGQLGLEEARVGEANINRDIAIGERTKARTFQAGEAEKARQWQKAMIDYQNAYNKSQQPSARTLRRKSLQGLLTNVIAGAATGGISSALGVGGEAGLFGAGDDTFKNIGLGALFGPGGTTSLATQNISMQQLLELLNQ